MIYLQTVFKALGAAKGYKVVLQPTDIVIPTDRRIAVLGDKDKSTLLKLLVGSDWPTRGQVLTDVKLAPIYRSGILFHRQLSIMQNIRFFSRMLRIDTDDLFVELCNICQHQGRMPKDVKAEDGDLRRRMEIALLALLPFGCYLFEDIWTLAEPMRDWFFHTAAARQAGVIFGVSQPRLARLYAECVLVIREGAVYPFASVEEGFAFNEHR